jgi:hypothetical protein
MTLKISFRVISPAPGTVNSNEIQRRPQANASTADTRCPSNHQRVDNLHVKQAACIVDYNEIQHRSRADCPSRVQLKLIAIMPIK